MGANRGIVHLNQKCDSGNCARPSLATRVTTGRVALMVGLAAGRPRQAAGGRGTWRVGRLFEVGGVFGGRAAGQVDLEERAGRGLAVADADAAFEPPH